jgi:hypothetical protein
MRGLVFMEDIVVTHQMCMWFSIFMAGAVLGPKNMANPKIVVHVKNLHVGYYVGAT